jgi:pyrroline-5-carboxylate reductase
MMENAISPLVKSINDSNCIIITMAAGLCIEYFEKVLGIARPIIRIMPNTPCSVGEGMILYSCNSKINADIEADFLKILSCAGKLDKIPEGLIDAASAVSGCGPAFVAIFAEALADAAVACGIPRDKALLYSAQMIKGTAEIILSGEHPAVLKDKVCSPGGTTIAGVRALEEHGMRAAAISAASAAYQRTLELKK